MPTVAESGKQAGTDEAMALNNAGSLSMEERLLLSLAMPDRSREIGATANYTVDNCLDFARKTLPDFDRRVAGKTVLDYGCGHGWQAVAMRARCQADRVYGVDTDEDRLAFGTTLAQQCSCGDRVHFGGSVPPELEGRFDVVVSLSAFEHFADPAGELRAMRRQLRPGGQLLLAFAEPWLSHSGSHVGNFTRIPGTRRPIPWVNLVFSERALLTLRARFRSDRPSRLQDIEGGLNKMTLAKFERIIRASDLRITDLTYFATMGIPLVTRVPLVREFLTSAVSCVLTADAG
jgi:SAM-dependent methyltransferase